MGHGSQHCLSNKRCAASVINSKTRATWGENFILCLSRQGLEAETEGKHVLLTCSLWLLLNLLLTQPRTICLGKALPTDA